MRSVVSSTRAPSSASIAPVIAAQVGLVGAERRDVAHGAPVVDRDQVDRADRSARLADRARYAAEHPRAVRDLDADREAVLGARRGGHGWAVLQSLTGATAIILPRSGSRFPHRGTYREPSAAPLRSLQFPPVATSDGDRARRAVPDRRQLARLPRLLRAAGVDRDLDGLPDERDLRLRLDAREDPHRVRPEGDDRRVGPRPLRAQGGLRRLQGAALLAAGPAQAAVAAPRAARGGLRLRATSRSRATRPTT